MERRYIRVKVRSLRRELEFYVAAHNKILSDAVKTMGPITLLRNAHPIYRGDFALALKNEGIISKEEAQEFVKIR